MALKVKATEQKIKVGKYADTYRYVMAPELYTTLNQNKVITEAALRSGISKGVMQAAWDAAGEVIKAWVTEGHSVAIPGLGNMRFGLRAKSVANVNEVKAGLIRSRRIIFTPDVDLKNELADTAIQITCYDRNGNEVKRVTSDDEGTIEDNESLTPGPNTVANGDSLPFVGPEPHSGAPLKTPVAPVGEGGYVSISGVGDDGIQVDQEEDVATTGQTEDHEDENSGTIYTEGGTLIINNSTNATTVSGDVKSAKGMKALCIALNAGDITINMSGNASKAISCGDGTKTTTSSGGWGPRGGSSTKWTNVTGSYTQGLPDGTGPKLTISQTGSAYNSSSAKAIKAICAVTIYGGETEIYTKSSGGEGLESKTSVDIQGGKHYFQCYDDCINSAGKIMFNGGVTVCWSTGNDAVDSNAGTTGAITIGDGVAFAYTTKGAPEEGFDCDNNSYIQITGTGIGISAGAN